MTLFERLWDTVRNQRQPGMHSYRLDDRLQAMIEALALEEKRPQEEVASRLIEAALVRRDTSQVLWSRWELLSRREKEVTALTCLGYTNQEMADRLGVSATTIKTHLRNILVKFDMHGKAELRIALKDWDFTAWENTPHT